jgi:hypothetical protein
MTASTVDRRPERLAYARTRFGAVERVQVCIDLG